MPDNPYDEDVEEFNLSTITDGWPADSEVGSDESIKPTPIRIGVDTEQRVQSDPSYTVVTEGVATCFHCGVKLGEYSSVGAKVLTHGDGDQFYSMVVKPEDAHVDPAHLAAKIGRWIREIHKTDIINELYRGKPLFTSGPHRIKVTAPPAPAYTETHPNQHLADVFNELVGDSVRQIAAALHIVEILGPMKQWTVLITDTCGFKGQLILRVTEMGEHTDERSDQRDVPAETGSESDTHETSQPTETNAGHGNTGGHAVRNRSHVHSEEREEYRHDPSDPAHDDGPFSI